MGLFWKVYVLKRKAQLLKSTFERAHYLYVADSIRKVTTVQQINFKEMIFKIRFHI